MSKLRRLLVQLPPPRGYRQARDYEGRRLAVIGNCGQMGGV